MKLPFGFRHALEAVLNRYLSLDPDAAARMAGLAGHCIAIELRGIDLTLFMLPGKEGIRIMDSIDAEDGVDTTLHGTPLALARLGLGSNTGKTLFSGDVAITGDVETGQAFKAILDDMDIDWEEPAMSSHTSLATWYVAPDARSVRAGQPWNRTWVNTSRRNCACCRHASR